MSIFNFILNWLHINRRLLIMLFGLPPLAMLITLSFNIQVLSQTKESNSNELKVKYIYQGMGMGPNPFYGAIRLRRGFEKKYITLSIINTIQSLGFNIIEPDLSVNNLILQDVKWKTDIIKIRTKNIIEHNNYYPDIALPTDRIYGLRYAGVYSVDEKSRQIIYKIESKLYQRGYSSNYSEYPSENYSGQYFLSILKKQLKKELGVN